MCDVKIIGRFTYNELRERLGIVDIITLVQQNRLRWYRHAFKKG